MPPAKKSEILGEAQKQGFDAVLVVIAEPSVPDPALIGGVMLVREKKLGVDRIYPCAGIVMRVWRVSDGKQIGFTTPKLRGHDLGVTDLARKVGGVLRCGEAGDSH